LYAIVDIETTGGYAAANGITEISVQVFDGTRVIERFESLVNPLMPIPRYIQAMTGITDAMVENAPLFEDIADQVYAILKDRIFIAHNVNFDYSFIKSQLASCGFTLNSQKLCTVRLSRKLLPGFPSYSLGNLCHSLGIMMHDRHRAGGDASATVKVFSILLEKDTGGFIQKSLQRNSKEFILPPNVPKEHFEQLPYTPGVYYFHNEKGKVIYVGKAINVRYRVNSHFSNNSQSRQKQNFLRSTYGISYEACATELMACILESTEIKKLWPIFNYSQKRREENFGIYAYEDRNGFMRLAIDKEKKQLEPAFTFHRLIDGHDTLRRIIREYELCPKLCFMQHGNIKCEGVNEGYCHGACESKEAPGPYNYRVLEAIESLKAQPSFAIIEKGLNPNENSCVLMIKGELYGMGCIPPDVQVNDMEKLKSYLTRYKDNNYVRNLILSYAEKHPSKVVNFDDAFIDFRTAETVDF